MSFILDALRKSDARRRSEQGPSLVADSILTRPARRRRGLGMTASGVILLSTALVVFSLQPELVHRLMPRETAPPLPPSPTLDDLSVPLLPGEPASVARAAPTDSSPPAVETEREPERPTVAQAVTPSATEQGSASATEQVSPDLDVDPPRATDIGAADTIVTAHPPAQPTDTEPADYLMLWELPLAVRQDLPPLTMNLHLFTADETSRFVLINGQRRRQGERLPSGIEVVEIRPEGAILESNGYRFLLRR